MAMSKDLLPWKTVSVVEAGVVAQAAHAEEGVMPVATVEAEAMVAGDRVVDSRRVLATAAVDGIRRKEKEAAMVLNLPPPRVSLLHQKDLEPHRAATVFFFARNFVDSKILTLNTDYATFSYSYRYRDSIRLLLLLVVLK
jgi:hypothetical protein